MDKKAALLLTRYAALRSKNMGDDNGVRLPADMLGLMEGIEKIPPGGRAYITFEDILILTGQSCAEFVADHNRVMGTRQPVLLEPNNSEQRLYYVRHTQNQTRPTLMY
jgi:hypothetical protein